MFPEGFNFWVFSKQFIEEGGIFMYPILLAWVFGLAICLYKFFTLKTYDINEKKFYIALKGYIIEGKAEAAIDLCSNTNGIIPKIVSAGLQRADKSKELIVDAISTAITEHTPKIGYQLTHITLAANLSTLLGLLGTIQGLILAFASIGNADASSKAKLLSVGISNAMNTTALGLCSAITLLIFHAILTGKAVRMNDKIDEISSKVVDLINSRKSA